MRNGFECGHLAPLPLPIILLQGSIWCCPSKNVCRFCPTRVTLSIQPWKHPTTQTYLNARSTGMVMIHFLSSP